MIASLVYLFEYLLVLYGMMPVIIRNGRNIKVQCSDSIGYKDKLILGKGDNVICEIPVKKIKNEVMQLKRMFDKQKHNIQNNRHLI